MKLGEFYVDFHHVTTDEFKKIHKLDYNDSTVKIHGYTYCIISDSDGIKLAGESAGCSKEDQFNKAIGRKLSLERALFNLSRQGLITRDMRRDIWKDYFNKCKK